MTDTDTTANPAPQDMPQITVSDREAEFVARAADIDGRLNWDSDDHDAVTACEAAVADARHFVAMAKAMSYMPEFPPEEEAAAPIEAAPSDPAPVDGAADADPTDAGDDDHSDADGAQGAYPPPADNTGAQQQAAS